MAISLTVRQTPPLIERAERLLEYIHTRIASRQVQTGNEHLNRADFDQAAREFSSGPQTCGEELNRIVRDLESIVPEETDEELRQELRLIAELISEARTTMIRVLNTTWSSTSAAE